MDTPQPLIERLRAWFTERVEQLRGPEGERRFDPDRQRLAETMLALVLAFFLWFWVKMGREYTVNMPVSVSVQTLPRDMALLDPVPQTVQASMSGEGWELLSWSINPQPVRLEIFNQRVDLTEQIRQQVTSFYDVTLHGVEPAELEVRLEPVVERTVPVVGRPQIRYRSGYGPVGPLALDPDSVSIRGGESKVAGLGSWALQAMEYANVATDLRRDIPLVTPPPGIEVSPARIRISQQVSEFTQGERTLPVELVDFPVDMIVQFIPSSVTVRYLIPIETYSEAERLDLFQVVVPYESVRGDETGFVTPVVVRLREDLPIRVQGITPPRIAYYELLE